MQSFPASERFESDTLTINAESSCNTLGVKWCLSRDSLSLIIDAPDRAFTKRGLVSKLHTIFDPLGLISPIILVGKILQRKVLPSKDSESYGNLNWDDPLPVEFLPIWEEWTRSLLLVDQVQVNRSFYPKEFVPVDRQQLIVFSDASEDAIG